jgi:hypothetical protein
MADKSNEQNYINIYDAKDFLSSYEYLKDIKRDLRKLYKFYKLQDQEIQNKEREKLNHFRDLKRLKESIGSAHPFQNYNKSESNYTKASSRGSKLLSVKSSIVAPKNFCIEEHKEEVKGTEQWNVSLIQSWISKTNIL